MRSLNSRERLLLGLCFLTIFVVVNAFVFMSVKRRLSGSGDRIEDLKNEVLELRLMTGDPELLQRREEWLDENMPPPMVSVGRAQGELAEQLQQSLFEKKITIERQSLLDPVTTAYYDEVAVSLVIRGEAATVNEWLTTLQSPDAFQVINRIELELDTRSRETEPQARCEVIVARWFSPRAGAAEDGDATEPANDESSASGETLTETS